MIDLSILGTTMRMAAPILLAGTGALYNDRAGTTNITLEGTMLLGSFFAVTCSYFTQSWVMGALAGVATGVVISLLFYLLTVVLGGDDLVVGFAMNILLDGLSIFLLKQIFHQSGSLVDSRIQGVPSVRAEFFESIPEQPNLDCIFCLYRCHGHMVCAVSYPIWPADSCLRRASAGCSHSGYKGASCPFLVQPNQWRSVWTWRRTDFSGLSDALYAGNDSGQRFHRSWRGHLLPWKPAAFDCNHAFLRLFGSAVQ